MDSNGTRYHLLARDVDWGRCRPEGSPATLAELWSLSPPASTPVTWDEDIGELTLTPELASFADAGVALPIERRRGAAVDRYGNWFWISGDRLSVQVASSGSRTASLFWRPGIGEPVEEQHYGEFGPDPAAVPKPPPLDGAVLGGLAVTEDHYLVVGLSAPTGLLVFDLQGGGGPQRLVWPDGVAFDPFDMAARPRGGVYVLDRANARLWELDRHLLVISIGPAAPKTPGAGAFQPVEPAPPRSPTVLASAWPVTIDDAAPLAGEPIAVEAARDGTVLVLDRNSGAASSQLRRYRNGKETGLPVPLVDSNVGVSAYDMALASGDLATNGRAPLGVLYVVGATGNQAYAFRLSVPDDRLQAKGLLRYYPLRSFGAKALAADQSRAYYDFEERFVPLAEQPRPRFVEDALLVTPTFDGREPDCAWHRLFLDGCIPPGTAVGLESRAADELSDVETAEWLPEPPLVRRTNGSELPFLPVPPAPQGTWELLFQHARGRYLQLRLSLAGDKRSTPRLRALRAYYPRFSYLSSYLPAVYREDTVSASFLDRYLANPEGINTGIEDRIAAAELLFDPDATPAEYLDWLAGWYDIALESDWSEHKRRVFVRNAWKFFRLRGTPRGLDLALRLALEERVTETEFDVPETETGGPRIVERFRTRLVPAAALGDPTAPVGPRVIPAGEAWRPDQGSDALSAAFRSFVQTARGTPDPDPSVVFQPVPPEDADLAALWSDFAQAELGFVPAAGVDAAWAEFLQTRYRRIETLRAAWGSTSGPALFADVPLPTTLPPDGAQLRDWYQFQAVYLPMRRTAHAFTVLLPVCIGESGEFDHDQRRARATRVVTLQKPAHTVFDVKFYWAAFRVGEARLQLDTVVDRGSRSPALLMPLVLGRDHLGESHLGGDTAPVLTRPPSIARQPIR